jgi:plastocyanin
MSPQRLFIRLSAIGLMTFATVMIFTASINAPTAQAGPHAMMGMPIMPHATTNPATLSGLADVTIAGFAFNPAVITVTAGTIVRWTNADPFTHTTTSDIGSLDPWDSGELGLGGTFTKTFATPGTFGYHCAIHFTSMLGTVVVVPLQAPVEVGLVGSQIGMTDLSYSFVATINPVSATPPITFSWEATNQPPITRVGVAISDTQAFSWTANMTGAQWITVTVSNPAGSAWSTHLIRIDPIRVYLPNVMNSSGP